MTEYQMIAVEKKLHEAISKLAKDTHRTNGGMVREMFEAYIRSIPVAGKIDGDRVVWGTDTGRE